MNTDIVKGHWMEIKGKLRQQWSKLTENEVEHMKGNYEELCGKLETAYGYSKDKAEREVSDFMKKFDNKRRN